MKYFSVLLTATLFICTSGVVHAGLKYFTASLGLSSQSGNYFVESENQNDSLTFFVDETSLDNGLMGGLAFGYRAQIVKLELELLHRSLSTGDFWISNGNGTSTPAVDGSVSATSVMGNIYLPIPLSEPKPDSLYVFPFIGAGAGVANLSVKGFPTDNAVESKSLDDSTTVAAFQLILGLEFLPTGQVSPDGFVSYLLQYRWFATEEAFLTDSGNQSVVANGLSNNEILFSVSFHWD